MNTIKVQLGVFRDGRRIIPIGYVTTLPDTPTARAVVDALTATVEAQVNPDVLEPGDYIAWDYVK